MRTPICIVLYCIVLCVSNAAVEDGGGTGEITKWKTLDVVSQWWQAEWVTTTQLISNESSVCCSLCLTLCQRAVSTCHYCDNYAHTTRQWLATDCQPAHFVPKPSRSSPRNFLGSVWANRSQQISPFNWLIRKCRVLTLCVHCVQGDHLPGKPRKLRVGIVREI